MHQNTRSAQSGSGDVLSAFVIAWLLAGTLDIATAIFYYVGPSGALAVTLLQGIASGLLGAQAFRGGLATAMLGLALHYLIALIWTSVFFVVARGFKSLLRHLLPVGITYGVAVWFVMNLVVVPLSNARHAPIRLVPAIVGATILVFCIGLPIALVLGRRLRDVSA